MKLFSLVSACSKHDKNKAVLRIITSSALILLLAFFSSCKTPELSQIQERYSQKFASQPAGKLVCPVTRLDTNRKVVALTLDACGGPKGNMYDRRFIAYLRENQIPALLFINARWAQANTATFRELAFDPLFEIGSHGNSHSPCTVIPAEKYGIRATSSIPGLIEEVEGSVRILESLGAQKIRYFRSGTAWYDECSIEIIESLGYEVIGFDINSRDYNKHNTPEIISRFITEKIQPGSIIIMHVNHPRWNSFEGFQLAYPKLIEQGYTFVKISDYKTTMKMRTKLPK